MELPDLDSLRCFVAAAEHLNFRAAARVVALTPAALGRRIRQLEERLGAPLFARTTRSVQLTEAGLSLLPACLAEAAACVRAARGEEGAPPASVTFATRFELGMSWIVPALPRLAEAVPRATVRCVLPALPRCMRNGMRPRRGVLGVHDVDDQHGELGRAGGHEHRKHRGT